MYFVREESGQCGLLLGLRTSAWSIPAAGFSDVCLSQGDENRLCGLLEDLRQVRAVSASPRLCHPSRRVLEKAKELNRVR